MNGIANSRDILLFGSNDRAGLATCRALGRVGHRVSILRLTAQRTLADHSRFCQESLHIGSPDSGVREYLGKLTDLLRSRRFDYLIPLDDLACELIYSNYEAVSSLTRVVGPNPASYAVARNNIRALAVAESIGLARPITQLMKQGDAPVGPPLPCFVRPVVSCAIIDDEAQRFTARKVNTTEELDAKLRDDLPRTDMLLQIPVSGARLDLNFCSIDGDVLGASATSRIHELPRGGSSYGKIEDISPRLLAVIEAMARKLSWTGFMTIDCKVDPQRLSFIKIIGRPCGSTALSSFAGVDFPNLLLNGLESRRGGGISLPVKTVYTRDLRRDVIWLSSEARKGTGLGAIVRWIASFRHVMAGSERFEVEQLADPLPAIRQFDQSIRAFWKEVQWRWWFGIRREGNATPANRLLAEESSLLVVCQGNINRSVVAEHLFRARGFTRVRSAGLLGIAGRRASGYAERFLADRVGVDISTFRSKSVSRTLKEIDHVDLVLCFERKHVAELVRRFPHLSGKVFLLSTFADGNERWFDIADPHGQSQDLYLECFRQIDRLVERATLVKGSAR